MSHASLGVHRSQGEISGSPASQTVCILGVHSTWRHRETLRHTSASWGFRLCFPRHQPEAGRRAFSPTCLLSWLPLPLLHSTTHPDPSGICPRGGSPGLNKGKIQECGPPRAAAALYLNHTQAGRSSGLATLIKLSTVRGGR